MAKFPSVEEMAKEIAEKALDTEYKGKTIREWIEQIASEQGGHSEEEWEKALQNIKFMKSEAQCIPMGFIYVAECNRMLRQYEQGDRSDELYEEMINAH